MADDIDLSEDDEEILERVWERLDAEKAGRSADAEKASEEPDEA